jgi:hypothetical protein
MCESVHPSTTVSECHLFYTFSRPFVARLISVFSMCFVVIPLYQASVESRLSQGIRRVNLRPSRSIGFARILLPIKPKVSGTEYTGADTKGGQPCSDASGMRKPKLGPWLCAEAIGGR